jgi:methionyl-tRNA formyltransferase
MRCVFLGLARGALALAGAGHEVSAVGLCRRPRATTRAALEEALGEKTRLFVQPALERQETRDALLGPEPPLLVCYFWDRIIPASFLKACTAGAINVHPSLLPRHRGPDPVFWTLWRGDAQTGVTLHMLDVAVDRGDIVAQRAHPISPGITAGALAEELDELALELLLEVLAQWDAGAPPESRAQDDREATSAPIPGDDLLELDWSRPAEELLRLIRAASPHPGAFTALPTSEEALVLLEAHRSRPVVRGALEPGDVFRGEEGVVIWAGDGGLVLDTVQLGEGHPMTGAEAIAALFPGLADLRGGA